MAYRRSGDEHGGAVELEAALATFERLGARPDEARIQELLGRVETRRTFLFTDIVDSTRLLDTLGDEKWRRLLARHDELIREAIAESGGEVVKQTGDGFFASFESARAAVEAAVAIQRALAAEIVAPDVRIGAHAGGAFRTDSESSDYGGQGVHVAARVGAAAGAGEILVSAETLDGVSTAFRLSAPRAGVVEGRRGAGGSRLGRLAMNRSRRIALVAALAFVLAILSVSAATTAIRQLAGPPPTIVQYGYVRSLVATGARIACASIRRSGSRARLRTGRQSRTA